MSLASLTVVSGLLDAVSYLGLGHVFTANMTGNVVLLGFAAAGAAGFSATASLCALASFVVGAVLGGRFIRRVTSQREVMLVAMVFEVVLTAAAAIVAGSVAVVGTGWPRFTVIGLLALTMGVRNTAVKKLAVADMTTTVLTTTLTGLASDSTLAGGTNINATHRATSVVSMFSGALIGALLLLHAGATWAIGVGAAIVACTALFFYREVPASLDLAH
jgi:uncharacterized membrane protein YoaK (UPF0700 family)